MLKLLMMIPQARSRLGQKLVIIPMVLGIDLGVGESHPQSSKTSTNGQASPSYTEHSRQRDASDSESLETHGKRNTRLEQASTDRFGRFLRLDFQLALEKPNHEHGAEQTPSQYPVSSFTSPEGNLTFKSSSPSSLKVALSTGKRPSKNPKFLLPAATSAFESELERLLTRTHSPCPVASAKSAASQFLHTQPADSPLPTTPICRLLNQSSEMILSRSILQLSNRPTGSPFLRKFEQSRLGSPTAALPTQTSSEPYGSPPSQKSTKAVSTSVLVLSSVTLDRGQLLTQSALGGAHSHQPSST